MEPKYRIVDLTLGQSPLLCALKMSIIQQESLKTEQILSKYSNSIHDDKSELLELSATVDNERAVELILATIRPGQLITKNAMFLAVKKNNVKIVTLLMKHGYKLSMKTNDQCSLTYLAANNNATDVLKFLIQNGVEINSRTSLGDTPLHGAAYEAHVDAIKILLEANATLNVKNAQNELPIHIASMKDNFELNYLLSSKQNINCYDDEGYTPMMYAVEYNVNSNIIKMFIKKGADVNLKAKTKEKETALHLACKNDNVNAVKVLLEHNVDVTIQNSQNLTALLMAKKLNKIEVLNCFTEVVRQDEKPVLVKTTIQPTKSKKGEKSTDVQKKLNEQSDKESPVKQLSLERNSTINGNGKSTGENNKIIKLSRSEMESLVKESILNKKLKTIETILTLRSVDLNQDLNKCFDDADEKSTAENNKIIQFSQSEIDSLLKESILNEDLKTIESILTFRFVDLNKCFDDGNFLSNRSNGNTLLHAAVQKRNLSAVKLLLSFNANIHIKNFENEVPLHFAAEFSGDEDNLMINDLLSNTDTMKAISCGKFTPLHIASYFNQPDAIHLFAKKGANLNIKSKNMVKDTPMTLAATLGSFEAVKALVENNADINIARKDELTPLMAAATKNKENIVEYLIENGASISEYTLEVMERNMNMHYFKQTIEKVLNVSVSNNNPKNIELILATQNIDRSFIDDLMFDAVRKNCKDVVTIFLKHGCSLNMVTMFDQCSLIYLAARFNSLDVLKFLIEKDVDVNTRTLLRDTPLHGAAYGENLDATKLLLNANALINIKNCQDEMPIHIAARQNNFELNDLLSNQEFINWYDQEGYTPLMYAVKYKVNCDMIKMFIKKGADVNLKAKTKTKDTALHLACENDSVDAIKHLLQCKALTNIKNFKKELPIHIISKKNSLELNDLLSNDVNINIYDQKGYTPLMHSVINNVQLDIIQLFIKKGANINLPSKKKSRNTVLHMACDLGNTDLVKVLLEHNADVTIKNSNNLTALMIAKQLNKIEVVKCFPEEMGQNETPILVEATIQPKKIKKEASSTAANTKISKPNQSRTETVAQQSSSKGNTKTNKNEKSTDENNKLMKLSQSQIEAVLKESILKEDLKTIESILTLRSPSIDLNKCYKEGSFLFFAVKQNSVSVLKLFIKHGADLFKIHMPRSSLLYLAVEHDAIEVLEFLIDNGMNINIVEESVVLQNRADGNTLLHAAVLKRNLSAVKLLLKFNAKINVKNFGNEVPLHYAAEFAGDEDNLMINDLLSSTDTMKVISDDQFTPLHIAGYFNQPDAIHLFAKKGANLNIKSKNMPQDTPMTLAAALGSFEAVKALVENNADFNIARKDQLTPLMAAATKNKENIVDYLIEKGASICDYTLEVMERNLNTSYLKKSIERILKVSATNNNTEVMKLILPSESIDRSFINELMFEAVRKNCKDVVTFLLKNGCMKTVEEYSLTYLAAKNNSVDVLKFLIQKGADVNSKTLLGNTPLHAAAYSTDVAVIKLLLKAKASINIKNDQNELPIHIASVKDNFPLNDLLSSKEIINCYDQEGYTPLMHSVMNNIQLDIIQLFIKKGANIDLPSKTKIGNTVLHMACDLGNIDLVKVLLEHNADVTIQNSNNLTALMIAEKLNKIEVVKCFTGMPQNDASVLVKATMQARKSKKDAEALQLAFLNKDEKTIRQILSSGYENVNEIIGEKGNCLQYAVLQNLNILQLLKEMGGDLLTKNSNSETLLYVAASCNSFNCLEYLIDSKSGLNSINNEGNTALHAAAINQCLESVKILLKAEASNNIRNKEHQLPIHIAATKNNVELNQILATKKNLLLTDKNNMTPLHLAAEANLPDILKLFINKGVDVDLMAGPFIFMSMRVRMATPLLLACFKENFEAIEALIENKADIYNKKSDCTPLEHATILIDNLDMTRLLLKPKMIIAKIDSRLKTVRPSIPAYFHVLRKECKTVSHAVQILSDMSKLEREYLLNNSIKSGHYDMVELLLSFCDVNEYRECEAPVSEAIFENNIPIMKLLIERGADLYVDYRREFSLLHTALTYNFKDFKMAELLISNGICVNSIGPAGATPLHYAIMNSYNSIAKQIVEINPETISDRITCKNPPTEHELLILKHFFTVDFFELLRIPPYKSRIDEEQKLMHKRLINNNSLHLAIVYDNSELIQLFADLNADLNEKFTYFNELISPVLAANYGKAFNALICLLKNGSDIDYVQLNPFLILNLKLDFVKLVFLDRLHNRNI